MEFKFFQRHEEMHLVIYQGYKLFQKVGFRHGGCIRVHLIRILFFYETKSFAIRIMVNLQTDKSVVDLTYCS